MASGYLKGGGGIPDKTMVTMVAQKLCLCRFERDKARCPGYLAHGLQMTCEESQGVTMLAVSIGVLAPTLVLINLMAHSLYVLNTKHFKNLYTFVS